MTAAIGIVGLLVCLALLVGLSWLCEEVFERESFSFDTTVLLSIHQWANPALDQIMLTITQLGNPPWVITVVALSLGWMFWKRRFQQMKVFAIACLGALILNQGLKLVFVRPRPLLWKRLIKEVSYSFPSGHALGSLVLYGFLAYLLGLQFPRWSRLIYGLAVGLIGLIGLSRLYLGVHYPTDVIAGYAIGFLWLMMCIVMLKLQPDRSA
ncbi:MAG TPA: phosphatase PAP2 family protein [Coleofasciculaceae cyanobacterium]